MLKLEDLWWGDGAIAFTGDWKAEVDQEKNEESEVSSVNNTSTSQNSEDNRV